MKIKLPSTINITESIDSISSDELVENASECLLVSGDPKPTNVYLNFSSRLALYDFARSLLREAIYGKSGQIEFNPIEYEEGELPVINGVRMSLDSTRLFIFYKKD